MHSLLFVYDEFKQHKSCFAIAHCVHPASAICPQSVGTFEQWIRQWRHILITIMPATSPVLELPWQRVSIDLYSNSSTCLSLYNYGSAAWNYHSRPKLSQPSPSNCTLCMQATSIYIKSSHFHCAALRFGIDGQSVFPSPFLFIILKHN